MKVSVIMNTVNEKRNFLDLAIESYLQQKGCEIELIISTLEDDPNIQYIKQKFPECIIITMPKKGHPMEHGLKRPIGSFMQLNNALPHITGDWFCFASSNDVACTNKFELEIKRCKDTGKEVCYSSYDFVTASGRKIATETFPEYNYEQHLKRNFVADCSLISRRIVDKYLPFNVELNNMAYWDLWLRVHKEEGNVFCYNPITSWDYRQDSEAMHVSRKRDPIRLQEEKRSRIKMLALHT